MFRCPTSCQWNIAFVQSRVNLPTNCTSDLRFGSVFRRVNICMDVEVEEEEDDDCAINDNSPLHPQWKITSGVQCPSSERHYEKKLRLTNPQQHQLDLSK